MEEIFINIDSKYRDQNLYPNDAKFKINLENTLKNIGSITISSLEINNSINFVSSTKENNYITIHLPNKINDPEGTQIVLNDGILHTISSIQSNFNDKINSVFNSNISLQKLSYNNKPFAEKYFYIFYLNNSIDIIIDYYVINSSLTNTKTLTINEGWCSIYGLVIQIQNFIIEINNIKKIRYFKVNEFILKIFDRRFRERPQQEQDTTFPIAIDCVRIDTISEYQSINSVNLNLTSQLNSLKTQIYKHYIYDTTTFIPSKVLLPSPGILDNLLSNNFVMPINYYNNNPSIYLNTSSLYHINNNSSIPFNESIQLYNLSLSIDTTGTQLFFNNSFTDILSSDYLGNFTDISTTDISTIDDLGNYFYYSTNDKKWISLIKLLNRSYLRTNNFITEIEYNNPSYITSLYKDIPEYEIDFNTSKNLENPVKDGIINVKKIEYPSIGYYMGYKPNMLNDKNRFLKTSKINNTNRIIQTDKNFDTFGDNYIFIKINNWGYIDFFGEQYMAKILLSSCLGNQKIDTFVNQNYIFRQPVNIYKLDIELVDYLGNTLDIIGSSFSCSLQFKHFISSDKKELSEKQARIFNLY
jgi:hypothetical protein